MFVAESGSILALLDPEVYVVTAGHAGRENGLVVTWISPARLGSERARLVAVISPHSFSHDLIRASGRFGVNLLAEGQHELVPRFGLRSGRDGDKFMGLDLRHTASGLPILPDTCGFAECRIVDAIDSRDRIVYLAEVVEQRVHAAKTPLRLSDAFAALPADVVRALDEKRQRDAERDRGLIDQR